MTMEKKPVVPVITTTTTTTSQLTAIPPEPFQMPETIVPPPLPSSSNEDEKYWNKYGSSSKVKLEPDDWDSSSKSFNSSSHRSSSKYEDDYEYDRYSKSSKYDKYEQGKDRDYSRYHRDDYDRGRHRRGGGGGDERERDRRDYRRGDERGSTRKEKEFFEYPRESRDSTKYDRYGSKNYSRSSSSSADYYGYSSSNYPSGTSYERNYPPYPSSSSTATPSWVPLPPKEELSPPRPPPEPADLSSSQPPPPVEDDDEDQIGKNDEEVDLDTRIAMIFDTKAFGDENNKEEVKVKDENDSDTGDLQNKLKKQLKIEESSCKDEHDAMEEGELNEESTTGGSSIASPFETRATYRNNKKFLKTRRRRKRSRENKKVESGASDISSSEDELIAKGSYSPPLPRSLIAKIKAEDEMSLSSLSSTEHPIKEDLEVADEFKNFDPSSYMYQHMPGGLSSYQNYYYQFQQPHMQQWNYDGTYGYAYKNEETDDPHEVAVKKVIEKLIQELKYILRKDFNKRMIENTAFKKYEAWWDDQERNKNTRITHETETPVSSSIPLNPLARDPLSETYLPAGPGSSLGMLRNIRFQRIKREAVPTPIKENSRKSDNEDNDDEDVVHGSDSEKEDLAPTSSYINKRKISDSSSSDSSESDISSSEDDEDEEEKDEHAYSSDTASLMSDDELVSVKKTSHAAKKEKENNRIYSDSDSDQEAPATTSTKSKLKIYSDSEDDEQQPEEVEEVPKKIETREKTPEGKTTPVHPPVESDSDFFNDDVMSKPPRTPGRSSSDDQQTEKVKAAKPTSLILQKEKPAVVEEKKAEDFNDRMYSDSEEERDYQERIRRNTEWMEQTEREAKEEMEKQNLIKSQQPKKEVIEGTSTDTSRATSPFIERKRYDEPFTPTSTSLPPITPGADLSTKTITQDLLDASGNKKKRGRPKGSLGKIKEPKEKEKKVKNGAISKIVEFAQPQNLKPEHEQKYSLKLSPSSSSDGGSSQASLVAMEHCYSLPPSASPSTSSSPNQEVAQAVRHLDHDHGYYGKLSDVSTPLQSIQPAQLEEHAKKDIGGNSSRPVGRPRKDPNAPKAQYTKKGEKASEKQQQQMVKVVEKIKKIDPIQHQQMIDDFVPVPRYTKRPHNEEFDVLCRFLTQGIDQEDVDYMKRAYTYLIQNDIPGTELLHQVHWVDHCASDRLFDQPSLPKKRRRGEDFPELRKHATGCARTEGFYKIDSKEKAAYKYHHLKGTVAGSHLDTARIAKMQNASREARSNQRRLLTAFAGATESDLLKFNQLKFRKKQLKFAKSAIHDWGLFAMEPIAADEMVIEYVGQMVRPSIADFRETKYEAIGIGSSYLFRIDLETIIDATKCGNLARFINHSCNVSNFLTN